MKFKIIYQESQKLHTIILEAKSLESLPSLDIFPQNIIKIVEIKKISFSFTLFKNTKKEVYELFTQLDIMLSANLTFSQSIDLLLEEQQEKNIDEVLSVIKKSLSTSLVIDQALHSYRKYLGETSILFLKLGFENGNIKESVHSLVKILEEDITSREMLTDVMRYPLILLLSLFVSVGMIFMYVLPNFEFIFRLLDDNIPFSTYILLTIKNIFDKYWMVLFGIITIVTVFISFVLDKYRYSYHKLLVQHLPLFSKVIQNYYFYRLFLSMSIIVKSKYQFQIAITNSKNIVNNLYVQDMMEKVLINIKNGMSVSEAFGKSKLFDNLTMKLLHTADNTNRYEDILSDIALQYKKRFQKSLKNFSSTIEPLLILIIALIVLWLILAIMLPIWNLSAVIN